MTIQQASGVFSFNKWQKTDFARHTGIDRSARQGQKGREMAGLNHRQTPTWRDQKVIGHQLNLPGPSLSPHPHPHFPHLARFELLRIISDFNAGRKWFLGKIPILQKVGIESPCHSCRG
jgi:hypothetical protein